MERVLESSTERRILLHKRDLTLDLFARHGEFWTVVERLRSEYGISATTSLPTIEPDALLLPPGLFKLMDNPHKNTEWWTELGLLHSQFVPAACRAPGTFDPTHADYWSGFLASCLYHDPPADQLLKFAGSLLTSIADHPAPSSSAISINVDKLSILSMVAPPIVQLRDPNEVYFALEKRFRRLLAVLHERLLSQGIDIMATLDEIERNYPDLARNSSECLADIETRAYITVDLETTTEEDVRNAFRLLTHNQATRPARRRPSRDRLTCVQCAIWHDQFQWSLQRIGETFGWTIQEPLYPGYSHRCETARAHIAEGRILLKQKKSAD